MGIASFSSTAGLGCDFETPFDSVASTFCVCVGFAGNGTSLTTVTPIALPPPPAPQFEPDRPCAIHAETIIATATPTCCMADRPSMRPQRSCSKKISVLSMGLKRLRHNADVRDPRRLYRVHHRRECAKRHVFISPQKNRLVSRIANLLPQLRADLVDVDRIAPQEHFLLLINAD